MTVPIYLDNAATSFPKPETVIRDINNYLKYYGVSHGRSGYNATLKVSRLVFKCRENLARLFNIDDSSRIAFTLNATYGLNTILQGFLKKGDTVITTLMEHNAVMRPLNFLKERKRINIIKINCDSSGYLCLEELKKNLTENIKLVIINHASNVTGALQDLIQIGGICRKKNVPLLVDAAQTAGSVSIDVKRMHIDMMAFSGHKGLMGPTGVGAFYIKKGIEIFPLAQGGTGSKSEEEIQPEFWPDKMESGTLNVCAIAGLNASLDFIFKTGIDKIQNKKNKITDYLLDSLKTLPGINLYGSPDMNNRISPVSINIKNLKPSQAACILNRKDICVRVGLHCAPAAHKTIGTFPDGTIRISPGYFTTKKEIDSLIKILKNFI